MSGDRRDGGLFRGLTMAQLWAMVVMAAIWVFASTHPIRPHDFWWHLKAGEQIVTRGAIPTTDTFSFTAAGAPYAAYATFWLPESAYYVLFRAGGLALIIAVHAVVIALAYGILMAVCRGVSGSWRLAAAATFAAAALGFNDWNVRPQAIGLLLACLDLALIYAYRARPRAWLLIGFPVTQVIWVNSHGAFVVGIVLVAIWLLDEAWRARPGRGSQTNPLASRGLRAALLAAGASMLACLVNPRGPAIAAYVTGLSTNYIVRHLVPEWAPPAFGTINGTLFLLALLGSAALLSLSPRRPQPLQMLTFLLFAALGLQTSRGIVWYGIAMAPVWAEHLGAIVSSLRSIPARTQAGDDPPPGRAYRPRGQVLNLAIAGGMLLVSILALPWFKHLLPLPPSKVGLVSAETPVEATRFLLQERFPAPIFNDQAFGSYLIWAAPPPSGYPVFVDTRIELYPARIWQDYLDISAARCGWEEKLAAYGVNTLMLSPEAQPALIDAARRSASWRIVYEDRSAVILVRNTG